MTHPHHHHALAALWSLRTSWPHLTDAAARAQLAVEESGDAGTLRSQVYGVIGPSSGHGDPIGDAIEREVATSGLDRYTPLLQEIQRDFSALAAHVLDLPGAGISEMLEAVPTLPLDVVRVVGEAADVWDRRVRKRLGREIVPETDHVGIRELNCPSCDASGGLAWRSSAPGNADTWPVICAVARGPWRFGCVCRGPGCGCGMTAEVAGVAHVWTEREMTEVLARTKEQAA